MMKKFILLFLIVTGSFAQAQLLDFGVMGGLNVPNFKIKDSSPSISDINLDSEAGFHIGAMLRINLVMLYVQPELLYTKVSTDYAFKADAVPTSGTYNLQRLDIPVPVGLKLGPAAIFAGPVASINLSSPNQIFDDGYKKATLGYQVGAGIKFIGILAEVKYEGAFHSHSGTAVVAGQEFDLDGRMNQLVISVGYFF